MSIFLEINMYKTM